MASAETLRELTLIPALAGHEQKMIAYMKRRMSAHADQVHVDSMGNVIARLDGTSQNAPRIMIFAHMDQLGFIVKKVEPNGFIRLERLGGIPEKVMPGQRVCILAEDGTEVPGVIGVKSHHVTPAEEKYKVIPYSQLYVDIGVDSKEAVEAAGVYVGAPVTYYPYFMLLGDKVSATSLDNRAGCLVLLEVLEQLAADRPEATVFLVGTVQEEFNLRGVLPAARAIRPDFAVAIDLAVSGDTPDLAGYSDVAVGAGPVMQMYTFHGRGTLNGTLPHPGLVKLVKDTAASEQIPLQRGVFMGGLTDASYVQLEGDGVPAIDLAFPARYTHTPVELCSLKDLDMLARLITAIIRRVRPGFVLTREF